MWANLAAAQKKLAGGLAQATHLAGDVLADMKAEYADREDIASEEEEEDEASGKPIVRMYAQARRDSADKPALRPPDTDASEIERQSEAKDLELEELREKVALLTKDAKRQEADRVQALQTQERELKSLQAKLEAANSQINALKQECEENALKTQEELHEQIERERKKQRETQLEQEQKQEQQAQELASLTAEVSRLKKELLERNVQAGTPSEVDGTEALEQQREILALQEEVASLKASLHAAQQAQAGAGEAHLHQLQQAREQIQQLHKQLHAEQESHKDAIAKMQKAARERIADDQSNNQNLVAALQQKIERLTNELKENEERAHHSRAVDQLQGQLQDTQQLLQAREAELAQLKQTRRKATGLDRYFEDPTDAQAREEEEDESELAVQRALNVELAARNAEILERQALLEEKLAGLASSRPDSDGCCTPTQQLAVLKAEIKRLNQEAEADKRNLGAEIERLRQELLAQEGEQSAREDQMATQVEQLQQQQARDAETLRLLTSQQESIAQQLLSAKQQEENLRAECQASREQAAEMASLVEGLKREVTEKTAHIATLGKGKEEIMIELTSELEKAQNERAQLETLLMTCQKQYDGAVNQIKKLQQECRDVSHNDDAIRQKAAQAEALAAKYKGEIAGLQARLDRVLQNQADTQEGVQEEQSHLLEQIATLKGEVAGHQAMVDRLNKDIQVRAIRESEIREAAERDLATKDIEVKLAVSEAERLRAHLREVAEGTKDEHEEVYQLNQQLRAEIRQLQLDAAAASSLASDLSALQKAFDLKNRECESNAAALANLETVIGSFQKEALVREQRLSSELQAKKAEAESALRELSKYHDMETKLSVAEKIANDSKNELLAAQRHSMALTGENSALRARLAKFQQHPTDQHLIDRRIVVKMLMAYFERSDKEDVIQVMYRMFQFSQEERDAVERSRRQSGLKSGIAKVASLLSPFDEPPPPLKEGDNLADLWVDFLLKESSKKDNPRRPSTPAYPSSSSQDFSPPSPPTNPTPADLAALPVLSGHYPSIRPKVIASSLSSAELLARHGPRSRQVGETASSLSASTISSSCHSTDSSSSTSIPVAVLPLPSDPRYVPSAHTSGHQLDPSRVVDASSLHEYRRPEPAAVANNTGFVLQSSDTQQPAPSRSPFLQPHQPPSDQMLLSQPHASEMASQPPPSS